MAISLLPLARTRPWGANRDLLFESLRHLGVRHPQRGPWKYNEYSNGDRELYDLSTDPCELDSQDGSPANAAPIAELSARLAQIRGCAGPELPLDGADPARLMLAAV